MTSAYLGPRATYLPWLIIGKPPAGATFSRAKPPVNMSGMKTDPRSMAYPKNKNTSCPTKVALDGKARIDAREPASQ